MRNLRYTLAILFLINTIVSAQIIVQDATESSSIRFQGSALSFDITQARTSFQINRFLNDLNTEYKKFPNFFAVQASANSKDGIANILSSGKVVPEGTININIGHSWVNESGKELAHVISQITALSNQNKIANISLTTDLNSLFDAFIVKIAGEIALITAVTAVRNTIGSDLAANEVGKLAANPAYLARQTDLLELQAQISAKVGPAKFKRARREAAIDRLQDAATRVSSLDRFLIYGILGVSGSKFMYLQDPTTLDNDKRFKEKKLEAGRIGVGFNWRQGGKGILGISFTYNGADNFSLLDDKEYTRTSTVTTTTTTTASQPTSSTVVTDKLDGVKKFTAYSGDVLYDYFRQSAFNIDYVRFYPGITGENTVLVANYYLRQKFSSNSTVYPEVTDIGAGGYFFKSRGNFLGGLYVELSDIFNNIERMKVDPTLRPVQSRFTFGIVTKLTFGSVAIP